MAQMLELGLQSLVYNRVINVTSPQADENMRTRRIDPVELEAIYETQSGRWQLFKNLEARTKYDGYGFVLTFNNDRGVSLASQVEGFAKRELLPRLKSELEVLQRLGSA